MAYRIPTSINSGVLLKYGNAVAQPKWRCALGKEGGKEDDLHISMYMQLIQPH